MSLETLVDPIAADKMRRARRDRYRRRDLVWEVGQHERTRQCGRRLNGTTGDFVHVVSTPNGAGFRGLAYCGSVWSCAVCSAVVRTERANELDHAVRRHFEAGGFLLFITFTVPHRRRDTLAESYKRIRDGLNGVRQNRKGRELFAMIDRLGDVTAVEVTHGRNGWHPHLHMLLFVNGQPGDDTFAAFRDGLRSEWEAIAARRGWGQRPNWDHGIDVQLVRFEQEAARYIAKVQGEDIKDHAVALEMTRGDMKAGRRVSQLTPFEILDGYERARIVKGARGARRWVAIWREYEDAMKGKRCIVWSNGLRAHFDLEEALSDEDIANAEPQEVQDVVEVPRYLWRVILCLRQRAKLLEAMEKGGVTRCALFFRAIEAQWEAGLVEHPLAEFSEDDPPDWWAA